jgi:HTH-type transcriptional regulator/antitoxin HigA
MATKTRKKKWQGPPAETYAELVDIHPPRPLHDKADYQNAVEMLGRLVGYELNDDQEDYLDALATFVERYENEHPRAQVDTTGISGLDTLRGMLERTGMSGADLARLLDVSPNMGPMILRGERTITADHARKLGEHFKLDPGVFIRA